MVLGALRCVIAALTVAAGAWLSAAPASAYVFGKDDRIPLPQEYAPLKYKIGFLYTRRGNFGCTASCVAKDMILTAAHCVLGGRGKRSSKPPADLKFYLPNKHMKGYFDTADAVHQGDYLPRNVFTGVGGQRTYNGRNVNRDWAYVKLNSSVCKRGTLPLKSLPMGQIAKAGKTGKLLEIAFHGDKEFGKTLYYTNSCSVKGVSSKRRRSRVAKTIKHTCDLKPGASGSPLLMNVDGKLSIVGVNVAQRWTQRYLRRGKKIVKRYKRRAAYNMAVHSSAFIRHHAQIAPVKLVTNTSRLERIQRGLKDRKFYTGKVDGVFGPATRNAIRKFEKSANRPLLGLPTVSLLDQIGAAGAPRLAQSVPPTKTSLVELEQLRKVRRSLSGEARKAMTLKIYRKLMEHVAAKQKDWGRKTGETVTAGTKTAHP